MTKDIFIVIIIAIVVGVAVFTAVRSLIIRKKGVEAEGVISRIEEQRSTDSNGSVDYIYTYYVIFRTQDGQEVEAMLNHATGYTRVGDPVKIKYLPEKPGHAVLVK